jgi:hypothetical protein
MLQFIIQELLLQQERPHVALLLQKHRLRHAHPQCHHGLHYHHPHQVFRHPQEQVQDHQVKPPQAHVHLQQAEHLQEAQQVQEQILAREHLLVPQVVQEHLPLL